jgi:hypothetical protein
MSRKKTLQDLMEAVSFAEAGEVETASELASEIFPQGPARGQQPERIIALSGAPGFSDAMIERSLGIAERLSYGLIALTAAPATSRWAAMRRRPSSSRADRASVEAFRARALQRQVPFVHATGQGDPAAAVVQVRQQFRRIAFLLIEPDLAPKSRFSALSIPIFCLADE